MAKLIIEGVVEGIKPAQQENRVCLCVSERNPAAEQHMSRVKVEVPFGQGVSQAPQLPQVRRLEVWVDTPQAADVEMNDQIRVEANYFEYVRPRYDRRRHRWAIWDVHHFIVEKIEVVNRQKRAGKGAA